MPRYTNEQIIEALQVKHGMVYLAAEYLRCSHNTILKRIRDVPKVKEVMKAYEGRFVDTAELKLEQKVLEGEAWAVQFALKTKGKDRGYVEHLELDVADALQKQRGQVERLFAALDKVLSLEQKEQMADLLNIVRDPLEPIVERLTDGS